MQHALHGLNLIKEKERERDLNKNDQIGVPLRGSVNLLEHKLQFVTTTHSKRRLQACDRTIGTLSNGFYHYFDDLYYMSFQRILITCHFEDPPSQSRIWAPL